ncbi:hypothetical protein PJW08_00225 (plasmid) [Tenacibaculum finnmarkense]|nr:hypothetical protein PJW08_00225 [Tenacibaculum finnmarkense]
MERSLDSNGKVREGDNSSCPFLFQGQYYDAEIELAYNRFRYYDPEDGRYISVDPIGLLSGEFGFYNYVGDSNLEVDRLGLSVYRRKNGQFGKKPGRKSNKDKQRELDSKRQKGVSKAWKEEQSLVSRTGQGSRRWSEAEIDELNTDGKVSGYEGHHINSVKNNPNLADNPNNIKFVTPNEHLAEHGGSFHNQTSGDLITR